jgi:putative PIN family toxin of toxin-antitoxin system
VATFAEISAVLARPRFSYLGSRRDEFLALIAPRQAFFEPVEALTVCRDPEDDVYLELAVASEAWAIATGDEDLLVLDPFRQIRILRPADYLSLVGARGPHPV